VSRTGKRSGRAGSDPPAATPSKATKENNAATASNAAEGARAPTPTTGAVQRMQPLGRTRLVDEVTHRLRDMIIYGDLPPGTQLLQTELAARLGVSRTPLREAFRLLESDGMVRISNGNRTIEVVRITADELEEMFQIREPIDGLAARLAAQRGLSDEVSALLEHQLEEMEQTTDPYDPARRVEAHTRFHSMIAEHCGNSRMTAFLQLIRVSSASLFVPFVTDPKDASLVLDSGDVITHEAAMLSAQAQHRDIYNAIVARRPADAERAARHHIRRTLAAVRRLEDWHQFNRFGMPVSADR
jgi:GntR family transcriptional regulator of vanillate catabolism